MSLLGIIVGILLITFALYIVRNYVPAPYATPVLLVIVVLALVWIVSLLWPGITTARVGG